ncbi:leukotriene B4 receptor 2-like [Hemiscyllium ocellatum]|uniref:leukotriene B4 receptor 2-like n=1 Tax=Hemiscyllium ocellatum TaxID=170820 RepID=UPI0029675DC4|nr:leukotriene B4 receptor 2-like [Hemiscyllium ocellatum]
MNGTSGPVNGSCDGVSSDDLLSSDRGTVLGCVVLALALALGLPGNAYVVWALLVRGRPQRPGGPGQVTALLVLHLAVADGVTLLTAPFWIRFLARRDWEFGLAACKGLHYVCCLNMYASVLLLTAMGLDRLLAVTRPLLAARVRRPAHVKRLLVVLWLLAAILAVPAPYYRQVVRPPLLNGRLCEPQHLRPRDELFHYLTETVCGFLVPYGTLLASYGLVAAQARALRWGPGSQGRARRLGGLIVAVVTAFGLLWLPYHAVNLAQAWARARARCGLWGRLQKVRPGVTALAFVSSGVNPALYAFASLRLLGGSGPRLLGRVFEGTTGEGGVRGSVCGARVAVGRSPSPSAHGPAQPLSDPQRPSPSLPRPTNASLTVPSATGGREGELDVTAA